MAEKNQSEREFFDVVATGRRGVEDMLAKMADEIKAVAAPNVKGDWETWIKRIFVDVVNREELTPVLSTRQGIFSLYQEIAKAGTAGFQLGGIVPHGYFMPKKGKVVFVPAREGYAFCAVHGPGAVLRHEPALIRVYEHDAVTIDVHEGKVKHAYDLRKDRGRHVGWYMVLEYLDGRREVPYVTAEKAKAIMDAYSRQTNTDGKLMPSFAKSPEEMADKTAAKHLLRKPFREAVGLAMYRTLEGDAEEADTQPMRDVTERVGERLELAAEALDPAQAQPPAEEPKPEPAPAPAQAGTPPAKAPGAATGPATEKDLF